MVNGEFSHTVKCELKSKIVKNYDFYREVDKNREHRIFNLQNINCLVLRKKKIA